jgi:hypothetical protein
MNEQFFYAQPGEGPLHFRGDPEILPINRFIRREKTVVNQCRPEFRVSFDKLNEL